MGRKLLGYLKVLAKCPHMCFPERSLEPSHDREDDVKEELVTENLKTALKV